MRGFLTSVRHEWHVAEEQDRAHVRWGALVAGVYVATAVVALTMQVVGL